MRELNAVELEQVSGGACDFFSTLGAIVSGGWYGVMTGSAKGAATGGANGGVLGFGLIGEAVGAIWGGISGAISGAWYGLVNGWDKTSATVSRGYEAWADPTASFPK
ncbi:hypothetical protein PQQ51_04885 [Paraburkholderia xenovorans]|uniref:hypothetical protein n=1 Tax=Paraburkholderia xenovorans TaxID=36873 RepID=UPI0038BCB8CC